MNELLNYFILFDLQASSSSDAPEEFYSMVDKDVLFKVEVTKTSYEQNWRTYTIKRMSGDDGLLQ